jgi:hypothetical protein
MKKVDTLIIGGGVAGLACGRKLARCGCDFLLLTDRLGGRVYAAAKDRLNFGAAYVTSDYAHMMQFLDRGKRIWLKDVYFFDGERYANVFSRTGFRRIRGLAELYRLLFVARRQLNALRRKLPHACQKELLEEDPVLRRFVAQPATELVSRHGLSVVNEIFCAPVVRSTIFVPWHETNAFYFLAITFPAMLPTYTADLSRTAERISEGWQDRIVRAKATAVEEVSGGEAYVVEAGGEEYRARRLVMALPCRNSRELLDLECNARDIPYCTIHIRGTRRKRYVPGRTVFLRDDHPITVMWPQHNGMDIAFAPELDPDLSEYYSDYEIVRGVQWKTAAQLSGDSWRPLRPRENLFTIGDHNVFGMEDTYLTGLYAANRIAEEAGVE